MTTVAVRRLAAVLGGVIMGLSLRGLLVTIGVDLGPSHFTPIGGVFGLGLGLLVAALVRE